MAEGKVLLAAAAGEVARRRRDIKPWDPLAGTSPFQRPILECDDAFVSLCFGRRSGKSDVFARDLRNGTVSGVNAPQFYVGPTLKHARLNFWPVLKGMFRGSGIGYTTNETDLQLVVAGRAPITLAGAKDLGEIDKLRGGGGKKLIVDEAQSHRPSMLAVLVDEVSEPMLMDHAGKFRMGGTPGPIPAGYWYEAASGMKGWRAFTGNVRGNPNLPYVKAGGDLEKWLADLRERHGWTEESPTYQREYMGKWVRDEDALVLHYDATRNAGVLAEPIEGWRYVLGVDLGYVDSDAFVVLGWAPNSKEVHLVYELVREKQWSSTTLAQVEVIIAKYKPIRAVVDAGGLGKKIVEEWRGRWRLPIEATEKKDKVAHIVLIDEALRAGLFKAPPTSRFAEDCGLVQWDAEKLKEGERKLNDEGYHSDVIDAALYSFRAALAFHQKELPPGPVTPDEIAQDQARQMRVEAMAAVKRRTKDEWWEDA